MNANTEIYDKLVDRAAMVRLYEESAKGKVFALIDGHQVRITNFLENAKFNGKYNTAFWDVVDKDLRATYRNVGNTSKKSLLDLVGATISYGYQTLDASIGSIWRVSKPSNRIAEDIVLKRPLYNDQTLEQGWSGVAVAERKRLELLIRKGIADGLTPQAIALELRKGNVFTISKQQSEALVITATTSVVAQTDHEVYAANKAALQGYQYVSVLDSRTTPICVHRDGRIYPIGDIVHLPPAHYRCRSRTTPIVKSYEQLKQLEGIAQLRKRNLDGLSAKQIAWYDGVGPLKETYHEWLYRQPRDVQLRHLGDTVKLDLFTSGKLTLDKFIAPSGAKLSIKELRGISDEGVAGQTAKFASAKNKLDQLNLGVSRPDELLDNAEMTAKLREYYLLQAGELDGTLSITNYRGQLLHTKRATKNRVLSSPPTEEQTRFNPITGRYEDVRLYAPSPAVLQRSLRLVDEDELLRDADKAFINKFIDSLELKMGVNERAVVTDNLRVIFTRFRKNKEPWGNFKAVLNSQMQYDVMNVSEYIETQLRKDADLMHRLKLDNYIDPVLGPVQLDELHDSFHSNIKAKIAWEDRTAPKIARELRNVLDRKIPPKLWVRLDDNQLDEFYLRFANRLSLADSPDRDQLAVSLGRDLYNSANWRGSRREWYNLGVKILDDAADKGFYKLETFGVQKRRMKSRMSGAYFGPYYDTFAVNLRIVDPRIQEYARLTRAVEVGMRVPAMNAKQRLIIREGYKTYFIDNGILGHLDTRIPITSTSSFSDFPVELVDADMANALNWSGQSKYKVDPDFHDFVEKLLFFRDDKGKAAHYDELNQYREHIIGRGDSYERFKAMKWLRDKDVAFSNNAFLDHRARIYERGLIGPQSGESFRPFLSTDVSKPLGVDGYYNLQDQIGAFLGGLTDKLEGPYNSLTITGRQKIAERWRPELIKIGNAALRGKPNDIRYILDSEFVALVDGEEQGKMFRLAIEMAKIDKHLSSSFPSSGGLFHLSDRPLANATLTPRVPSNFLTKNGFEDATTLRVSFGENIDDALKAMSSDLRGKELYVYSAPPGTKSIVPSVSQVPDVKITSERWVKEPVDVTLLGKIKVGKAIEKPYAYKYGDNTAELYGWDWEQIGNANSYSSVNIARRMPHYKTALALEQDASSSGAQIIALTTRNKKLAELSNVIPTRQKKRLYDEIAALTFDDPRFKELNKKLGLTEKELRKAAKAANMVSFYGAGERTQVMNIEAKLAKALAKDSNKLVIRASERDVVLNEISARMARYEKYDPDMYLRLKSLRKDVKDCFDKGLDPGLDMMEQLYFLGPKEREFVERMSRNYSDVITPQDFRLIGTIMSENMAEQVPILKSFTRYFGRLAEDFLLNAKPKDSAWDIESEIGKSIVGTRKKVPDVLKRLPGWKPNSTLADILFGVREKKLPKKWTSVPSINFSGKTIEQTFTQSFEEKLVYKDADGNWVTNFVQIPQKTDPTVWEQLTNVEGKINDIADVTQARTGYGVSMNHSNDATLVKAFHLWGRKMGISTSTIHDAFFANAADMLAGRRALRAIYADTLDKNVVKDTLDEMLRRGLPRAIYNKYLEEAINTGLIPVAGRSVVGGKVLTDADILRKYDVLAPVPEGFNNDLGFYGVG